MWWSVVNWLNIKTPKTCLVTSVLFNFAYRAGMNQQIDF